MIKIIKEQKKCLSLSELEWIKYYDWAISQTHSDEDSIKCLTSTNDILLILNEKYTSEFIGKINLNTPRKISNFLEKNWVDVKRFILYFFSNYVWKKYYWSSPIMWDPHTLYKPWMKVINKYIKEMKIKLENKKTRKKIELKEEIINDNKIVEALYVCNKEAKKIRDKKLEQIDKIYWNNEDDNYWNDYYENDDWMYDYSRRRLSGFQRMIKNKMHDKLHDLKYQIEDIYELKSKIIEVLKEKWILKLEWYHIFDDGEKRDFYTYWNFSFHNNENTSDIFLWNIWSYIDSEKKLSRMSFKKAKNILDNFLEWKIQLT